METSGTHPIIIALLFVLRCLVPLAIMLGISHLLRHFGLIHEPPPPDERSKEENEINVDEGDLAHDPS
jgi:hypothetical protein